jgi:OTT_1508-like deaminase
LRTLNRGYSNLLNSERTENAQKLKRRLGKVYQYVSIGQLISFVKRLFPEGDVPFYWVERVFDGTGEGSFELCSNLNDAVCRGLDIQIPLAHDTASKLANRLHNLAHNWATRGNITTCVHAELRIILELSSSLPPQSNSSQPPSQLPIGCSKRSCICCALWMYAFNYAARTGWMTSGSHGKPYATWALPGNACNGILGDNWMGYADEAVVQGIKTRLTDTLSWLQPGSKRPSDEHVSNDSSSDNDTMDSEDSYLAATSLQGFRN